MATSLPNIYFVTGGAGFVGSVLIRSLVAKKQKVHLLLKSSTDTWRIKDLLSKVTVHDVSLLDRTALEKLLVEIQPTIIYHLAARGAYVTQNDPDELFESNVVATWNLISASKNLPYHLFVNTGSSSEYGYYDRPMLETDRLRPTSWYAATKAANSLLAIQWAQQLQKPIVHVRLFSVYGPYEEPGRLFPTLLTRIFNRKPLDLVAPQTARDFIYVDDVVAFYENVEELKKCTGQTLNVGRGEQVSLEEVVKVAFKVTKCKVQTNWDAYAHRPWDTSTWQADMKKTFNLVSWRPTTTLNDGITKMWKWYPAAADIYKE
jgi:nucleoside-diphosphate-sugar epimerase